MSRRQSVLILCTHNSCRSQMAEALLRKHYGDRYHVRSAGVEPSEVNCYTIKVLEEVGVETSDLSSKDVGPFVDEEWDLVVTVCDSAKESCPFFPGGKKKLHRDFTDPPDLVKSGMEPLEAFRLVRDGIDEWVKEFFAEHT